MLKNSVWEMCKESMQMCGNEQGGAHVEELCVGPEESRSLLKCPIVLATKHQATVNAFTVLHPQSPHPPVLHAYLEISQYIASLFHAYLEISQYIASTTLSESLSHSSASSVPAGSHIMGQDISVNFPNQRETILYSSTLCTGMKNIWAGPCRLIVSVTCGLSSEPTALASATGSL